MWAAVPGGQAGRAGCVAVHWDLRQLHCLHRGPGTLRRHCVAGGLAEPLFFRHLACSVFASGASTCEV